MSDENIKKSDGKEPEDFNGEMTSIFRNLPDVEKLKLSVEMGPGFRSNTLTEEERKESERLVNEWEKELDENDNSDFHLTADDVKEYCDGINKVLQQDEVDDLLRFSDSGNGRGEKLDVRLPRLEIICDRFCRYMTNEHSNTYKSRIEWNPISIDKEKFGIFMRSLPVPTNITLLSSNVFGQIPILSVLDSRAVFALVESSMGTLASSQPRIEGREFTKIEQKAAIEISQQIIVDCLNRVWSEAIADIEFKQIRNEINPQFAAIVPFDEECIIINYELEIDCCLGASFQVIPMSATKPYINFLADVNSSQRLLTCTDDEFIELIEKRKRNKDKHKKATVATSYCDSYLQKFLHNINPQNLAMVLRNDHPQTLACIASLMTPELAARFVLTLPSGYRAEIIKRLDDLEIRNSQFIQCVEDVLYDLVLPDSIKTSTKGKAVLEALSIVSPETKKEIEDDFREEEEFAAKMRKAQEEFTSKHK